MIKTAVVIRALSSFFYVSIDNQIIECRASKKLKQNKQKIIVGDDVEVDLDFNYIIAVKKRTNYLQRPLIANVQNCILVTSAIEPKLNLGLLDRMILIMEINKLDIIIIITKIDLLSIAELSSLKKTMSYYQKVGYTVIYSPYDDFQDQLNLNLTSDKYVITGQSGVGKSTIINYLIPNLDLQTQEISRVLGRGKHTTREVTFYSYKNIYLIDTPGFSSLDLDFKDNQLRDNYPDFVEYSPGCKYKGCFHDQEPNCQIKKLVEDQEILATRYNYYIKMLHQVRGLK